MLSPRLLNLEPSFNLMLLQLYPLLSLPTKMYGFGQDIWEKQAKNGRGWFSDSEKPSFKNSIHTRWRNIESTRVATRSLYNAIIGAIWTYVNNIISFFTIDQTIAMCCVRVGHDHLDHSLITLIIITRCQRGFPCFIDLSILDWPMLEILCRQKFQSI